MASRSNVREFQIKGGDYPQQRVQSRQSPATLSEDGLAQHEREELWSTWEAELQESAKGPSALANNAQINRPQPKTNIPQELINKEDKPSAVTERILTQAPAQDLPWVARLALEERQMEKDGVVDYTHPQNKSDYIRQITREFALSLMDGFRKQIEIFNYTRKNPSTAIQIYRISNTPQDFMLFRNGVKLVVSSQKAGRIVFAFNQFLGHVYDPAQQIKNLELEAAFGVFGQIHWTYRGERVSQEDVIRYFLTEFIKQSVK